MFRKLAALEEHFEKVHVVTAFQRSAALQYTVRNVTKNGVRVRSD